MSADGENYDAYVAEGGSSVDLNQLQELATEQAKAEAEVARIEAELNTARETLKDLAERRVPELMDRIGIEEFKTRTGFKIKVEETIRASIPKARQAEAFRWLTEHNSESLIKRAVIVEFGRGDADKALSLARQLDESGYLVQDEQKVNPQTLSAWTREKLAAGVEIPLDLFGVFRQRVAKIKSAG